MVDVTETIQLPPDPSSAARARRVVADVLAGTPVVDDGRLIASELVTNALIHGSDHPIELTVTRSDGAARIEVCERRDQDRTNDRGQSIHGGFGLSIVERLSARWGIDATERRRVWSELRWRSRSRAPIGAD